MEENNSDIKENQQNKAPIFNMVSGLFHGNHFQNFANIRNQSIILDDTIANNHTNLSYAKPTRTNVARYLKNPESYASELRNASNYLYEVSTHYRRLINYFASLLTLDYVITPYKLNPSKVNSKSFETSYYKASAYLQNMNIKHEMLRILTIAYREDVFYGYIHEGKDSYYIQKLDPDYCKITGVVDSCFIYSFDFSYFDSHKTDLENFGSEFQSKYSVYEKDRNLKWQQLEYDSEFCIKVTESVYTSPIIPFAGVLDYIYQILDYIDLQETREELENYKIIGLKIPMDEDGNIQIDLDLARDFYSQLCNVLPPSVGAFLTPMEFKDVSFDRSNAADSDLTNTATKNFWNSAGISAILFGDTQTAQSLKISIKADIAYAMTVGRQLERNINRLLKSLSGTYKFQIVLLPVTVYNQEEMNSLYLKNAQYGVPCKSMIAATAGQTPSEMIGLNYLENTFLNLTETWKPLQSSYTQSSVNAEEITGRPTNESQGKDLSESGEVTAEAESNAEKVGI